MTTPSSSDIKNEFAWSWSRHRAFEECARKFYWHYYGYWHGWDPDAPADPKLAYRLRRLKSLSMLVGTAFHEALARRLRAHARPEPVPAEQLYRDMEGRLLESLRQSRQRDWERGDNHSTILFEDYYEIGIDDAGREKALEDLHASAFGLAAHKFGRRVFSKPPKDLRWIDPEKPAEKKIAYGDLLLFASPDLVVEDDRGALHIVDWKTGRRGELNLAQMAAYGLFIKEKFGADLARMTATIVYVHAGGQQTHVNLEHGAAEADRLIATYAADVRSRLTDVENNIAGDIERFPMTTDLQLCRRCNFRQLCNRMDGAPEPPEET